MNKINISIPKGAIFSEDRKYRYALWRVWSSIKKPLLFIGLNPSTAGETVDDPTITRMEFRATRGYGGLLVGNLFAFVSSNPDVLLGNGEFVGPLNDVYLEQMIGLADLVVCGWGSFPAARLRAIEVLKMIPEPYCLGVNKDGQPKHPLYVSYNQPFLSLPRIGK